MMALDASDRDPLASPQPDAPSVRALLARLDLDRRVAGEADDLALLEAAGRMFARFPYENLSKVLKDERCAGVEAALRGPREVIADHLRSGTGGTCFSLTAALLFVVRALGFEAEPLLADRRYGADTHCALAVRLARRRYLLDPGFLLVRPVPIGEGRQLIATPYSDVLLEPVGEGRRLELHTRQNGSESHRLTFKTEPADAAAFLRAWRASFDWDMMRYPVLARVAGARQKYLQGRRLQTRSRDRVERAEIGADELAGRISHEFGVRGEVVAAALRVFARRGGRRVGA